MNSEQFLQWCHAEAQPIRSSIESRKPLIMGILNITPDSFSDGGCFVTVAQAVQRAREMIAEGADIIDVGGESSKPGASSVSFEEEIQRVIPVIEGIRAESDICISIDTAKAFVMQAAVGAGASMINDITALSGIDSLEVAARLNVPVCLMHMRGVPKSMQNDPYYAVDPVDEINRFFEERIAACMQAGIQRNHLVLDPGFGFGKQVQHNLNIVKRLQEFKQHQRPLLLGVSRKSTIGAVLDKSIGARLSGSIATTVYAALQGVSIIRTHDVDETNQALSMVQSIYNSRRSS